MDNIITFEKQYEISKTLMESANQLIPLLEKTISEIIIAFNEVIISRNEYEFNRQLFFIKWNEFNLLRKSFDESVRKLLDDKNFIFLSLN